MRIGFDAKRALNNFTGLGNHSRILLNALMRDYPGNEYFLYAPKVKFEFFNLLEGDFELVLPELKNHARLFDPTQAFSRNIFLQPVVALERAAVWRSWSITGRLLRDNIKIYHGLSNELPFNIHKTAIKTVVTIHDLIFLKHTEQYPFIDRKIYEIKTRYAARHANCIIAVSEETRDDLVHYYKTPAERIEVIYQSADPAFTDALSKPAPDLNEYRLPQKYILHVGSFYPRKNQRTLIEAFDLIKDKTDYDLVLVGQEGFGKADIEKLIGDRNLKLRVHLLTGVSHEHLPYLYHRAGVFVYPSLFEGFGIPVLEALQSGVPVIASDAGAIKEAAGPQSAFFSPQNVEQLAAALTGVLGDEKLRLRMIDAGHKYVQHISDKVFAQKTMDVYNRLAGKM